MLRGLHYQLNPKAQTKLIRVLSAVNYYVTLDVRRNFPTFVQWVRVILSEYNKRHLLVPRALLKDSASSYPTPKLYKVDEYYSLEHDHGILWNDQALGIDWPAMNPVLSDNDQHHPLLKDAELNFEM